MINSFVTKLKCIGIEVTLHGNYPWVYLYSVNGNKVNEKYLANHGFTAFILNKNSKYTIPNRTLLFKIIRKYK